ncbi:hypothetical protein [Streptomyces sp. NPDC003832]
MERTPLDSDGTPLSREEYEAVHSAVAVGVGTWPGGQPCTLNSLFGRWRSVVAEIEEGYSWCAPELDNDIWCRGALARVWPLLPPRVRSLRQPALHELDERFRTATIPWPGRPEEAGRWWHRRIPRRLEAEADDPRDRGWPSGWAMMCFPKPDEVHVID